MAAPQRASMRAPPTALLRGVLVVLLPALASALLPAPLPTVCTPAASLGCFSDSDASRTLPVAVTIEPGDPFGANQTLETCAFSCSALGWTVAGVEAGNQCFCGSTVANVSSRSVPVAECAAAPCAGNPWQSCGGPWRVAAYSFTCAPFAGNAGVWTQPGAPLETRVADLVSRLAAIGPPALFAQLVQNGADVYAPTLQLPRYIVSQECLAGYDGGPIYIAPTVPTLASSSAFPQPVNLGNTFDAPLATTVASAISDEARAGWVHFNRPSLTCMSPNLNLARAPQWGRNYESLGEDPTAVGVLGAAMVDGLQYGGTTPTPALKVFALPKHLGVYSVECFNASGGANDYPTCPVYRSFYNAEVSQADLHEYYLSGWEVPFTSPRPPSGLMCSYNSINGVPACGNGEVLRGVLEGAWGSAGLVISDADAVAQMGDPGGGPPAGHNYTHSLRASAVLGLLNGTTVSLEDDASADTSAYHTQLGPALAAGDISLANVTDAVARALRPRFAVGLYDPPASVSWNSIPASVIESAAHHALARSAAADSYVLLTNTGGTLPLRPAAAGGPRTVAVVGTASNCTFCIMNRYTGSPATVVTMWEGVAAAAAAAGATAVYGGESGAAAIAAVAGADLAIVTVTGAAEGESKDRQTLGVPDDQLAFWTALTAQTQTPLVLVVISGGAVDVAPLLDAASAAIATFQGGMEAGSALGDVLWGGVNPSGALAATAYRASWAAASDFLNMSVSAPPGRTYRYLTPDAVANHVLFPFAYGLSYTAWEETVVAVSPPSLSVAQLAAGASVNVTVSVVNRGAVAGARTVLAFLARVDADPAAGWPVAWLPRGGIAKLHGIAPRTAAPPTVLTVVGRDVSRWSSAAGAFVIAPGNYTVALRDDGRGGAMGAPQASFVVTP